MLERILLTKKCTSKRDSRWLVLQQPLWTRLLRVAARGAYGLSLLKDVPLCHLMHMWHISALKYDFYLLLFRSHQTETVLESDQNLHGDLKTSQWEKTSTYCLVPAVVYQNIGCTSFTSFSLFFMPTFIVLCSNDHYLSFTILPCRPHFKINSGNSWKLPQKSLVI